MRWCYDALQPQPVGAIGIPTPRTWDDAVTLVNLVVVAELGGGGRWQCGAGLMVPRKKTRPRHAFRGIDTMWRNGVEQLAQQTEWGKTRVNGSPGR